LEAQTAFPVDLVAGHTYVIDAEVTTGVAKTWVKDAANDQAASEVMTKSMTTVRSNNAVPVIIPVSNHADPQQRIRPITPPKRGRCETA
jgi:hypothetical protein